VDNNDLDLGMSKSGFIHTLPSGKLSWQPHGPCMSGQFLNNILSLS
jgi:hypothetical protein